MQHMGNGEEGAEADIDETARDGGGAQGSTHDMNISRHADLVVAQSAVVNRFKSRRWAECTRCVYRLAASKQRSLAENGLLDGRWTQYARRLCVVSRDDLLLETTEIWNGLNW